MIVDRTAYPAHQPALRARLGCWRLSDDLDPDDVAQEAYSRFARLDSVDEILNPQAYLFSAARTVLLMHVRHARVISIGAIDMDALLIAVIDRGRAIIIGIEADVMRTLVSRNGYQSAQGEISIGMAMVRSGARRRLISNGKKLPRARSSIQ